MSIGTSKCKLADWFSSYKVQWMRVNWYQKDALFLSFSPLSITSIPQYILLVCKCPNPTTVTKVQFFWGFLLLPEMTMLGDTFIKIGPWKFNVLFWFVFKHVINNFLTLFALLFWNFSNLQKSCRHDSFWMNIWKVFTYV